MSISNLSNTNGSQPLFNARPSFLRDDGPHTLIRTLERYRAENADGAPTNSMNVAKLLESGGARMDYRAIAETLLARLNALRERLGEGGSEYATRPPTTAQHTHVNSNTQHAIGSWSTPHGYAHGHIAAQHPPTSASTTTPAPSATSNTPSTPISATPTPPATSVTTPTTTTSTSAPPSTTTTTTSAVPDAPVPTTSTGSTGATGTPTSSQPTGTQASSGPITLAPGATIITDALIMGTTGIVGNNATAVSSLELSNVTIRSTNYGIYLGSAQSVTLRNVDITADPAGGDSYSLRGNIRNLTTSDSIFRAGKKAFRVYGLEGGSSTRDTYIGGRLMLGGGYADEWGPAGSFHNFTFRDGRIAVNSVELYNNTRQVTFDGMDFTGTGHISIQHGARDIIFRDSVNLPLIKFFDASGNRYYPSAAELASRNIVLDG